MRSRTLLSGLVLVATDLTALALSYSTAFAMRTWVFSWLFGLLPDPMPFATMARHWYLLLGYVPVMAYEGLYTKRFVDWEEMRRCFRGVLVATAVVVILVFALRYFYISRVVIATACMLALLTIPGTRSVVRRLLARSRLLTRPLVLVGGGEGADMLGRELSRHGSLSYEVVGHVESRPGEAVEALLDRGARISADAVLAVFPDSFSADDQRRIAHYAERRFSSVFVVPSTGPLRSHVVDIEQVGSALVVKYRYNLLLPINRYIKRVVELTAASLLLVLLAPLLGVLALLVRVSSPGPVLFRQKRIGRNRREFSCLKFRTMCMDAEEHLQALLDRDPALRQEWEMYARITDDPRVTGVGRFLRRTSLDELPQFWNVLRGEMSLVGPRPYLPRESTQIGESLDTIVRVRPGLTGLWQVSGRSTLPFQERIALDEYYIRNWSLWLDLSIVLRTFWVLVSGRGAS